MKNPKFEALLAKMQQIHDLKNADYTSGGNPYSNFEMAAAIAGVSVDVVFRVLMGVKLARIDALSKQTKDPFFESAKDSMLDLAVYAALLASYFAHDVQYGQGEPH